MKKIKLFFIMMAMMVSSVAFAQNITVKGVVSEAASGEPIPFAAIQVKGSMTGATADMDGNYTVSVPSNGTLVFSSIGYATAEVAVNGRSVVNCALEADSESLDETIVVAYGVQKKSSFVGSASQISGEGLKKMQTSNISKSLEGSVAGLQTSSSTGTPGSGASIQIRGIGSISASTSPLIVVDGVPYEGSLNSIPTQDIESLTVLKDAAANSMYGARGSNGVIIITTKRGAQGKVNITFDAKLGLNTRGVPAYDIITDPGDYYEMKWEALRNAVYYTGTMDLAQAGTYASASLIKDFNLYNIYKGVADTEIIDPSTGKLNPKATQRKWADDWTKDVFRPGLRQEYNVSASGGSDKTQAYMSVSYLSDEGYVPMSGFDRISVRAKVDHSIGKFIKAGLNIAYSNTDQQTYGGSEGGSSYNNLFMFSQQIAPIFPIYLYDESGNKLYDDKGNARFDWGDLGRAYAPSSNPYGQLLSSYSSTIRDNMSSRGYINFNIMKDLVASVNVAYDVFNTKSTTFTTPVGGDALNVGGRGEQQMQRYNALNANQLLTWSPSFGDHNLNVLIGHETKSDNSYYLFGHMTNYVDKNNVDFLNATVYQELESATSGYFLEGFMSRAEYNFANKYFASASYRRDGSSRFAPENRWGSFWSLGAAWNVKQESFMQNVSWIDNLRLKASYGTQGNDNIGYTFVHENLYYISRVDGGAALSKTLRAAKDLTWEKSDNFNIGFEGSFLGKFSANVEYFIKDTKDMIYSRPLAPSQGSPSSQLVNDIDMRNSGIELELTANLIKTRDINWSVNFNATHYTNKLTKLPSDWPEDGKQVSSYWRELGSSLYNYYMFEWAGVDEKTGAPQYYKYTTDANGEETREVVNSTSQATYRKTGKTTIPDVYGGFGTVLSAYGFDFSASFAYQLGGYRVDGTYQQLMSGGGAGNNWHKDIFNRWTPQNTKTDVPRVQQELQTINETSTRFLIRKDYLSLRNLTIGYTLPSNLVKSAGISSVRVYLTGDNLWYVSRRKGLDVRQTSDSYSALRTVSGGVTLTF